MRRKTLGITLIVVLAMILTACGATTNGSGFTASNQSGGSARTAALTPTTMLAIGTFKLEGTPQAVNAAEAAKLIPLWQLMNQLETSSSTAPQEVTATVNAIQAAMTPAQVQAIQGMQISQRDVFTVLQQSGAFPSGFGGGGAGQNGGFTRSGNGGNFGGGNRGGGGGGLGFLFGGGPGGAARTPGANGAAANSGAGASGGGIGSFNSTLILQLVKLLQSKVQPG
ncbi:MAG: hypothetical protein M1282_08215 [Chloroflexi bacterium]|nr:hypothetical protein [Chloroflexota bacterium]